jgi:DNA polymerase III psi subunit
MIISGILICLFLWLKLQRIIEHNKIKNMSNISDEALALFFEDIVLFDINAKNTPVLTEKRVKKEKITDFSFNNTHMVFPENSDLSKNKNLQLFYTNILKAIRLDESKISFDLANNINLEQLNDLDLLICWGTTLEQTTALYSPVRLGNQSIQLLVDPIEKIAEDTALKSKLWQQLKMLYKV